MTEKFNLLKHFDRIFCDKLKFTKKQYNKESIDYFIKSNRFTFCINIRLNNSIEIYIRDLINDNFIFSKNMYSKNLTDIDYIRLCDYIVTFYNNFKYFFIYENEV